MSDDSAVQWSEYEAHRRNLESEIKQSICLQLQKLVATSYDSGESQCFIQGIERAHDFIVNSISIAVDIPRNDVENRLF